MDIEEIRETLFAKMNDLENPREILRDESFRDLAKEIPKLPPNERGDFGKKLNELKQDLIREIELRENAAADQKVEPLDITAPFDISRKNVSAKKPQLGFATDGTIHPLMRELATVVDIYTRMGFHCQENYQLDDDFHMFEALNFPANHPARDGYDTFRTEENFIPPAHDTAMDNRLLSRNREQLATRGYIAELAYGRVFRNEDADVTHDHTFYQYDGVFVSRTANLSQLLGVLRAFFEAYYRQKLKIKTQPSYFPFTEPSLEFAIEKPEVLGGKGGEWLEMLGCGMLHPNVLKSAGIDPQQWRGFAWGGGLERLVMLKYGIEDLRHFESGKLTFLREFK